MMDKETRSLWSHLLGKAMQGELKDTQLELLPAEMVTWEQWRSDHPQTTVLALSRTRRNYTAQFYRRSAEFVIGWLWGRQAYSVSFSTLRKNNIINLKQDSWALLVTFHPESTSAHIFMRELEGRELHFVPENDVLMRDEQTGSIWNRNTGLAIEGQLKGKQLTHEVGVVSFELAWQRFHPNNKEITGQMDTYPKSCIASITVVVIEWNPPLVW